METYYLIYSLLLLSGIFQLSKNRKVHNRVLWIWVIFFTLFGGLRWKIGGDWDQYYNHFLYSNWNNIFNYDRYGNGEETLEPLFVFFNVIIKTFFKTFYWYNIITHFFIFYTIKRLSLKLFNYPVLGFVCIMIVLTPMFHVRQGLSMAVLWWAYFSLKDRKLWTFLFTVLLAFSIHQASICFLPIFWIGKIKINWITMSTIYWSAAICSAYFQNFIIDISLLIFSGSLGSKLAHYTEYQTIEQENSISGWILNFIFLSIYSYIKRKDKLNNDYWYNTLYNTAIIYNLFFLLFRSGMSELVRCSSYFVIAHFILLINSISYLKRIEKKPIYIFYTILIIMYLIYRFNYINAGPFFRDTCIPYKTIFDYRLI